MALYLVGLNIDSQTAHYRAERGTLAKAMRGVYVDATDDVDETLLRHAVRIAKYLYPKAYLAAASAILLGPSPDGRLFISARRNQRTRLGALEIVQNQAPPHPSVAPATVTDPLGEVVVDVSSPRQRLLEAFRSKSDHAASITERMKQELRDRLTEEFGSPSAAADAVWTLARENGWYREGERAEQWLLSQKPRTVAKADNEVTLHVIWHGVPIGRLRHDGFEWRWTPEAVELPSPIRTTTPGKLPPFISALLPEGWLEAVLQSRSERELLLSGRRYLSNIAIIDDLSKLPGIPQDMLEGELATWTKAGRFTGTYGGPGSAEIREGFEQALVALYRDADTPRLSGVQVKAPMHLDSAGRLTDAKARPFTHILKPAGSAGFEALPVVEWLALELAGQVGFDVPARALARMPEDLPPALIVERFDIRRSLSDQQLYCLEDFSSLLGVTAEAKYRSTIERAGRALRSASTDPDADLLTLFRRALFAWLIEDGDMHLKNLAVLRIALPGDKQFRSVRLTPVYDTVTTRLFPKLAHDRMALKLNGKDDNLRASDFKILARTMGLRASDADEAIVAMREGLQSAVKTFRPPTTAVIGERGHEAIQRVLEIALNRCASL